MRQLILDTETTGLNAKTGDRLLEIGCVELVNRRLTGNNLHFYINPERDSDPGALAVHGLTTEFLSDKPKFAEIAEELREYCRGAEIIIHNAAFDLGFLDMEFARLGWPPFMEHCAGLIDTLVRAREMFPGKRNSLDALCDRLGVNNSHRTLHGALLDAELLADVYLAMTRGQESLVIDANDADDGAAGGHRERISLRQFDLPVIVAAADEVAQHDDVLNGIDKGMKGTCVWRLEPAPAQAQPEAAPAA
ncbi:DNA polymerase III subunit epsilon [Pandoraea nosoerga]|uniref:DNA polymerase III subunit epsilon n=1 Tax=Pandoraea nosoerga TaxID=2508296 RepID=A0A5E4TZM7_9BURK|nr:MULTISPECIES: DNA polymerase III subunit epsilon [Pandoraea]MBN4666612.1 DNA polymerase III subunit epsilon [Pandoraea nosoerga]MBN4676803.1 DNA polymerase III subunit epsilon [Pandoraea nosoerga]MBN4682615.1 DNA polymerase III subunit epsilon [Pandoraea nosoerga]MBN4745787.1 DNA polymerase III subunit epsilon [Pandoraea nosoerga]VVD92682.1 DNA polymerase III subunit epsilon [Pandoraea nosoerga]